MLANGTLHLLVESAVGGYVALSFTANPGTMAPAEAVLGYIDAAGPNVRTFYISQVGVCVGNRLPKGAPSTISYPPGAGVRAAGHAGRSMGRPGRSGAGLQTGGLSMGSRQAHTGAPFLLPRSRTA